MAKPRKTYKKRPIWHWVILYAIIGGVLYFLLYSSGYLPDISLLGNTEDQYNEVNVYE